MTATSIRYYCMDHLFVYYYRRYNDYTLVLTQVRSRCRSRYPPGVRTRERAHALGRTDSRRKPYFVIHGYPCVACCCTTGRISGDRDSFGEPEFPGIPQNKKKKKKKNVNTKIFTASSLRPVSSPPLSGYFTTHYFIHIIMILLLSRIFGFLIFVKNQTRHNNITQDALQSASTNLTVLTLSIFDTHIISPVTKRNMETSDRFDTF